MNKSLHRFFLFKTVFVSSFSFPAGKELLSEKTFRASYLSLSKRMRHGLGEGGLSLCVL